MLDLEKRDGIPLTDEGITLLQSLDTRKEGEVHKAFRFGLLPALGVRRLSRERGHLLPLVHTGSTITISKKCTNRYKFHGSNVVEIHDLTRINS